MRSLAWVLALCLTAAACATKAPMASAPFTPHFPDFVYPAPPPGTAPATAERLARGWRLLQANDAVAADREFAAILKTAATFAPARAAAGFAELARQRPSDALPHFAAALPAGHAYAPALVGRGLAQLALARDEDALGSFEAALAADAALPELSGRIELLRVRVAQDRVGRAERAAAAGHWDEARTAYRAAITASPESAFLHRDLALMERKAGRADEAVAEARAALALDGDDARAHVIIGDVLAERSDFEGALAAYRSAAAVEPSAAIDAAMARVRDRARDEALPPEYRGIGAQPSATRGDVAALMGVRLGAMLSRAPQRPVVVTDVRGHWARPWIQTVTRAGAMEVFSNYTFQPAAPLRRGDLADAVSRVLGLIAASSPGGVARWDSAAVTVSDVPPGHLAYPAVRRAVAAGVMPLHDGAFQLLAPVSGAEAIDVMTQLTTLAGVKK
ncbi:MAG: S-layer homology domain-containing protein [Acidobacteriota bacterium]